jgi:hypothetical protein
MPQDRDHTAVGAGATIANVLTGRLFQQVGGTGARLKLYACDSVTGGTNGDLVVTFIAGSDVICQNVGLTVDAAGPRVPDHQIAAGAALPGDNLTISVTNNGAAAAALGWVLDIENA